MFYPNNCRESYLNITLPKAVVLWIMMLRLILFRESRHNLNGQSMPPLQGPERLIKLIMMKKVRKDLTRMKMDTSNSSLFIQQLQINLPARISSWDLSKGVWQSISREDQISWDQVSDDAKQAKKFAYKNLVVPVHQ